MFDGVDVRSDDGVDVEADHGTDEVDGEDDGSADVGGAYECKMEGYIDGTLEGTFNTVGVMHAEDGYEVEGGDEGIVNFNSSEEGHLTPNNKLESFFNFRYRCHRNLVCC